MTAEAWSLAATAALLRQGRVLHLAAAACLVAVVASRPGIAVGGLALAAFVAQTVLAVRVGLDAELFARAADHPETGTLDEGLARAGLVAPPTQDRPWASRIAGARRMFRWQGLAAAASVAAAVWSLA